MITKLIKQINLKSINFFIKTGGTDKEIETISHKMKILFQKPRNHYLILFN